MGRGSLTGSAARHSVHIRTMSTNDIIASAGVSAASLSETIRQYRAADSTLVPEGTVSIEEACAALEVLAHRLGTVLDLVSPLTGMEGAAAELARNVSDQVLPAPGAESAIVAEAIGVRTPILAQRPVFGFPHLTVVAHATVDEERQTFVVSSYIVHRATESVFAVLAGESVPGAAARVQKALEQLSEKSMHRSK